MQAVAVAVVAVSVVACISCCQVSLWFKAHGLHKSDIFRVMLLNSQSRGCLRTFRMMIHKKLKEISNNQDSSISQLSFVSKSSAVWMKSYEMFMISGMGASDSLNHSDSKYYLHGY